MAASGTAGEPRPALRTGGDGGDGGYDRELPRKKSKSETIFCRLCEGIAQVIHPIEMKEVLFEIREDEIDGGFVATCLGHSIVTQAESVEELRAMIKDAVHCHFGDGAAGEAPRIIRLHFVRDEVLIA